jgi:hypothetical protein
MNTHTAAERWTDEVLYKKLYENCSLSIAGCATIWPSLVKKQMQVCKEYAASLSAPAPQTEGKLSAESFHLLSEFREEEADLFEETGTARKMLSYRTPMTRMKALIESLLNDLAAAPVSQPAPQTEGEQTASPYDTACQRADINNLKDFAEVHKNTCSDMVKEMLVAVHKEIKRREAHLHPATSQPAEGEAAPEDWKDILSIAEKHANLSEEDYDGNHKQHYINGFLAAIAWQDKKAVAPLQSQLQQAEARIKELEKLLDLEKEISLNYRHIANRCTAEIHTLQQQLKEKPNPNK